MNMLMLNMFEHILECIEKRKINANTSSGNWLNWQQTIVLFWIDITPAGGKALVCTLQPHLNLTGDNYTLGFPLLR